MAKKLPMTDNITNLNNSADKPSQDVVTFGCRLNIYESEIIRKNLTDSGLENVTVFNTCAVTKEAEKDAKAAIRKAKRDDPTRKIIVTGCAAQNNPKIFSSMEEVDKIIGNEEKLSSRYYNLGEERVMVNDIMSVKETANHLISDNLVKAFDGKARAFLQVQNGCDHRCTFCMIPYGRGNNRSVPIGVIVNQIKDLVNQGYNEVVLTGVDVTAYGPDLPGSPSFSQMIRRLLSLIPNLQRLRLSSIDVAEIDEDLFDMMAYEKRLMPHFHISLQAGDDLILKRMKRRHTRDQVIDFCHNLRALRPEMSFGADIIAGFPTETDEMFENTRKLISEAEIQYLHVFPYSEREGTPAARMPQIEKHIRKERASILRAEGQKELQKFYAKNLGVETKLLVEANYSGHTENFIPVKIKTNGLDLKSGSVISARLTGMDGNKMIADILS